MARVKAGDGVPMALRFLAVVVLSVSLMMGSGAAIAAPAPTVEQSVATAIKSLNPGQHVVIGHVLVGRTVQGLVVSVVDRSVASTDTTFCGVALAAAIVGIGAGILGVIAASTGPGTVVIAGYLLTGAQVGVLAGISGSYAALLAWISRYVC